MQAEPLAFLTALSLASALLTVMSSDHWCDCLVLLLFGVWYLFTIAYCVKKLCCCVCHYSKVKVAQKWQNGCLGVNLRESFIMVCCFLTWQYGSNSLIGMICKLSGAYVYILCPGPVLYESILYLTVSINCWNSSYLSIFMISMLKFSCRIPN